MPSVTSSFECDRGCVSTARAVSGARANGSPPVIVRESFVERPTTTGASIATAKGDATTALLARPCDLAYWCMPKDGRLASSVPAAHSLVAPRGVWCGGSTRAWQRAPETGGPCIVLAALTQLASRFATCSSSARLCWATRSRSAMCSASFNRSATAILLFAAPPCGPSALRQRLMYFAPIVASGCARSNPSAARPLTCMMSEEGLHALSTTRNVCAQLADVRAQ